jgi:DNA-directed RNA polymerase subunit N (RpoN/RPB10)
VKRRAQMKNSHTMRVNIGCVKTASSIILGIPIRAVNAYTVTSASDTYISLCVASIFVKTEQEIWQWKTRTYRMPIDIRCYTCGGILADKWLKYVELVEEGKKKDGRTDTTIPYLTKTTQKTAEGRAMDELGLTRECCRRHMLTHVELL